MEQLVISAVRKADIVGIRYIHRNCEDPWHDIDECKAWIEKRIERGFYIQIARIGNKVVGHGEWIINDSMDSRFLYLGLLQIDENYQKKGIGSKMVEDGVQYARDNSCPEIVTIPDSDNTSWLFYEKCGFIKKRNILQCSIDTFNNNEHFPVVEFIDTVPISVLEKHPFVFGLAQASSRHMWEVCNQKPYTDDRKTPAYRLTSGDVVQFCYYEGNDSALVLFWGSNPNTDSIKTILGLGYNNGLKKICFKFLDKYIYLFSDN